MIGAFGVIAPVTGRVESARNTFLDMVGVRDRPGGARPMLRERAGEGARPREGPSPGRAARKLRAADPSWAAICGRVVKRPLMREDLKVIQYQPQEADNTFITSDGTSPYNSMRKWAVKRHYHEENN